MAKTKNSSSKYNGVYRTRHYPKFGNNNGWKVDITINDNRTILTFATEIEAAKSADIIYIKNGMLDKLNILKPTGRVHEAKG